MPSDKILQDTGSCLPDDADVDFILVNGVWYKIKHGNVAVYIDAQGNSAVQAMPNLPVDGFFGKGVVYPADQAPSIWRAIDGNGPENYINERSRQRVKDQQPPLPNTPVDVPIWPGLKP